MSCMVLLPASLQKKATKCRAYNIKGKDKNLACPAYYINTKAYTRTNNKLHKNNTYTSLSQVCLPKSTVKISILEIVC